MAGPVDTFNTGADPDPKSFPPVGVNGPVAAIVRPLGKEVPAILNGFMTQMEIQISSGKRKRGDGYVGVLTLSSQNGRPPNQVIVAYNDIPGPNYGKLTIVERAYLANEAEHAKKFPRNAGGMLPAMPYVGSGHYMAYGAVVYHMNGQYVNMNGQLLAGNGSNAAVNPNAPMLYKSVRGEDDTYRAFLQQVNPERFGLPSDLATQIKQQLPTGAISMNSGIVPSPGQTAPGAVVPGAIDVDSLPSAPPASPAPAPAAGTLQSRSSSAKPSLG